MFYSREKLRKFELYKSFKTVNKLLNISNKIIFKYVCSNYDDFMASALSRSWPDLPCFRLFLIKVYQFSVDRLFGRGETVGIV